MRISICIFRIISITIAIKFVFFVVFIFVKSVVVTLGFVSFFVTFLFAKFCWFMALFTFVLFFYLFNFIMFFIFVCIFFNFSFYSFFVFGYIFISSFSVCSNIIILRGFFVFRNFRVFLFCWWIVVVKFFRVSWNLKAN